MTAGMAKLWLLVYKAKTPPPRKNGGGIFGMKPLSFPPGKNLPWPVSKAG